MAPQAGPAKSERWHEELDPAHLGPLGGLPRSFRDSDLCSSWSVGMCQAGCACLGLAQVGGHRKASWD